MVAGITIAVRSTTAGTGVRATRRRGGSEVTAKALCHRNSEEVSALIDGGGVLTVQVWLDAVTAVSEGPAYFFLLVEALVDAESGVSRQVSHDLAAQTNGGSAAVLLGGWNQGGANGE